MSNAATPQRVLILGGTTEGAALARALEARPGTEVVTSLAGRTREPAAVPGATRIGGFGGIDGLIGYLRSAGINLIIDATHPYAEQISRHAVVAGRTTGVPLLRLERPPWPRLPGDRWILVDRLADAARVAPDYGRRAFLTIGSKELQAFATVEKVWFLVRLVEAPKEPLPLGNYQLLLGRGPFTVAGEQRLFERHRIDMVIAKNSGGDATYAKIAAARALGLPVILLRRPVPPFEVPAEAVLSSVEEVLGWLDRR